MTIFRLAKHVHPWHLSYTPQRAQSSALRSRLHATSWNKPGFGALSSYRTLTTETGDGNTGHIEAKRNEGILFLNNVFPLRLQWLLWLTGENVVEKRASNYPSEVLKKALPESSSVQVTGLVPRFKEGGAFVRFAHDETTNKEEIEAKVQNYLETHHQRPWWNPLVYVHGQLVRGRPFVEDLLRRPPSFRLKIEFISNTAGETAELSQEKLYSLFRPYGKLQDIESQPSDSKILPKYAYLEFAQVKRAIMARNCLHNFMVPGEAEGAPLARLKISYEERRRANWIKDWLTNHPRITLPILFALAAGLSIVVFDPIRTFFIKMHVTRAFHFTDNRIYQWFARQANDLISLRGRKTQDASLQTIWASRQDNIEQLQKWFMESSDTFIVVQGPRGSGKRELVVEQALKDVSNKLIIDCRPIVDARGDGPTISAAADQVGYRPVFSWMNNISGLIDLAAQGATGMKTGFSETLETQLAKILANTATALKEIALDGRDKNEKHMSEDAYLEAHPERHPVVVIDNFLHKNQDNAMVYDKIAEWAASLTSSNIAHVIFLTTDVSFSKSLSKALPDRVFRQISLGDCAPDVAKRFVISHLDAQDPSSKEREKEKDGAASTQLTPSQRRTDLAELDSCISALGGRLTDLEFLARRIKAGETPNKAVKEIIEQSASEILKMYLFTSSSNGTDGSKRLWTPEQAWVLIKQLAKADSLAYNALLLSSSFSPGSADATLQALEQAELISIVSSNGRPYAIKPGKPVYQSAFRLLTEDKVLASRLNLAILNEQIKNENASIAKTEDELHLLGKLPKQPGELLGRVQWLLKKVMVSQGKIEGWEREVAVLKAVLMNDF